MEEAGKRWALRDLEVINGRFSEGVVVSPKLYGKPISPQFVNERADGHFFRFFIFFHIDKPKFIDIEKE